MDNDNILGCQVCLLKFRGVCSYKKHMRSQEHRKKMEEVFQTDTFKVVGSIPFIRVIVPRVRCDMKQPIIGLSLLTLCFSPSTNACFYLCHACAEKCPQDRIEYHLSSSDHCSNYFNYTDPNALKFSWVPSINMRRILKNELQKEEAKKGQGLLQMLHLPEILLEKLQTSTYAEVMQTLSENDKLMTLLKAIQPKRAMIQTYHRDKNRKHPLLGMQHIVECICVGPAEQRYYLCTLCNLTLANHMIIRHVLSFDHIFCYFKAWHPSTLMSKECYTGNTQAFASTISDLSKQAEKIRNCVNTDLKQVSLEPAQFASVNFTSYAKALKELESITKESLITTVTPGNKLEVSAASWVKVHCQNCSVTFDNIFPYFKHRANCAHKKILKKCFGKVNEAHCYDDVQTECRPFLGLFQYVKESCKEGEPVVGLSLVVTCVSFEAHVEPIYICFACEDCFSESSLRQHFNSQKHLIQMLLYLNPWRLPFAWENQLDVKALKSMAWEEDNERGLSQRMMKILDIPYWIFQSLISTSFTNVMKRLELQHAVLKRDVPRRETNSKLQQNERFPQLGRNFLVMSGVGNAMECCLCLLCEERLSEDQFYAHVFSRKHVTTFLERFNPGSVNSGTDPDTLLDLAKQATRIHRIFDVQVITLEKSIWEPCSYHTAIAILASAKRREGKGNLEPLITPGMKLVPRGSLKDVAKDHVRDNSQKNTRMMESGEKSSQTSTDKRETTLKKITEETGAIITATHCVKSENAEKGADKETPTPNEKESERSREMSSETSSEVMKNAGSVTSQVIKEEKTEEPIAREPTQDSCQNTDKDDGTDTGKERSNNSQDVLKQFKNDPDNKNERKRSHRSMSDEAQEDMCPNEDAETGMVHKRQCLTFKQEASWEEPQNKGEDGKSIHETKSSSNGNHQQTHQLWQYIKMKSRDPVIGLSALLECLCDQRHPIYLCECCSQKIPEKDIISHVTGFYHQKIYLAMLHKLPTPPEKDQREQMRLLAASFERDNGYGEAQVTDLDEEIYNNILKQDFKSAIQTVKAFQVQQFSYDTPPLSADRALDASVNLHAQHDSHDSATNFQVVEMEIDDDSKDCEAQPSSASAALPVMNETTSEVPPESQEDVKVTQIKVSESAEKAKTCLTVSRASEDASTRSTRGTNTTCLHLDSNGNNSKAEIIPNTSVARLKIETTSKIFGTSQTAASSDSTVTTHTTSVTAVSQRTVKSSISTQDTINVTGHASISGGTISNTNPTTKSARVSKPTESRARTASTQVAVASYKAATTSNTGSTVVPEATSRTAPSSKLKNITKNSETASKSMAASQTVVTSGASAKMSVNCENTEASAKTVQMKNSMGSNADISPNIPKHDSPAPPHLTTLKSIRSENENPPTEPSHISASHTAASKETPNENLKIGINQLIAAMCRGKQQVYCKLCSTRLRSSSHTMDPDHQYKYLKMKYPEWTAKPHEYDSKFKRTVAHLAKVEKDLKFQATSQGINVKNDVYQELAALPERKAIERLKAMMTQRDSQVSSSSTADTAENLRQFPEVAFASPCDVSSPDGGMYTPQSETGGQQEKRGDPELKDAQRALEDAQKKSPEKSIKTDLLPSAASVNTEQQSKSEASQKAEHVPKHPGCSPGLQALPRISLGETTLGSSHLSTYLKVKGQHTEPVIGLGFVWECRGVSVTLFLCASCQEKLYTSDICQHMVSVEHMVKYISKHHPQFLSFLEEQDLLQEMKLELLTEVAWLLAKREHFNKIDAQIVLLRPGLYECVQVAPFSEALKMVQHIKQGEQPSVYLPVSSRPQKNQKSGNSQSPEESPITERQSAEALETDQRSDSGARQQLEKQDLGKIDVVQDLDGVRQRRVLSPLNFTSVSSKDDSVFSPFPGPDPLLSPQETSELRPLASQQQRLTPGVHSESPSSSVVGPKASQTLAVFPGDPTRKRPPVTPDDMLVRPFSNDLQLEEPLQAKYKPNPESASESVLVYPAAASTLLSPKNKEPDKKELFMVNKTQFSHLLALVKEKKSQMHSSRKSDSDGVGNHSLSINSSSDSVVERRCVPATVPSNSSDGVLSAAAPVRHENQLITPSANNSSHKSSLMSVSTENEAKADSTMLPSASTADPSDPHRQMSVSPQSVFGIVSQFGPSPFQYVTTKHNPGQVAQPQGNTEAITGVCKLPINPIITVRPDHRKQWFMRGYNDQGGHTGVNRSNQVTQSFSRVGTANPSDTLADTGERGHSSLSPGPVAGYTTPNHHFTYIQGHPSQIGPGQEANSFGCTLATPTPQDWVRLMQQQQLMQQLTQQQQQQQQLLYFPWTSAALAAGDGKVTNEAVYFGAVPFTTPANNSQSFINLSEYRCNDMMTQSTRQVYLDPAVAHCPPPAHSGVISQESAHPFFSSGIELFTEAHTVNSATPPASRDTTS